MDTYSATDVARRLGTSVPRVQRAVTRLGMDARRGAGGRLRLTARDVMRLQAELGVAPPAPGLSRIETRTLAALARSPLGVISVRALAARAGVSPTAAGRALATLLVRGLVRRERETLALGKARDVSVLRANVSAPQWPGLAPALARVLAPEREGSGAHRHRRVPRELRHLFWNTDPSQLDVSSHGDYIARRLLHIGDLEGLAWGADRLSADNWRHAANARGLSPESRVLALNLADRAPA